MSPDPEAGRHNKCKGGKDLVLINPVCDKYRFFISSGPFVI